jgi:hypothetical protein
MCKLGMHLPTPCELLAQPVTKPRDGTTKPTVSGPVARGKLLRSSKTYAEV